MDEGYCLINCKEHSTFRMQSRQNQVLQTDLNDDQNESQNLSSLDKHK